MRARKGRTQMRTLKKLQMHKETHCCFFGTLLLHYLPSAGAKFPIDRNEDFHKDFLRSERGLQ